MIAKSVSYNVAHARTSAIDAAAAAAEAKHIFCVKQLYVTTPLKDIDRILTLAFPSSINQSQATQQLVRTIKSCLLGIPTLCDERNSEGLRSATWVPGWGYPLRRYFERTMTPDKPTTAPRFGQVLRALEDGASGPEALTLLRLFFSFCSRSIFGRNFIKRAWGISEASPPP